MSSSSKKHPKHIFSTVVILNILCLVLLSCVFGWAAYFNTHTKENTIPISPFTEHYHLFKDRYAPLKIFIYNKTYPVFQKYWMNLFSDNQQFWKHSSTPYFTKHTYAIDTSILIKIMTGPFVEKDGEKADLYFYKFIGSPFRGPIRLKHLVADCRAQGPYYERTGGIDHFFVQTIQHTLGECIINPEDHMFIPNMISTQSVEWQDSVLNPRFFERVTMIPVHSNLQLSPQNIRDFKRNIERSLNVYMIASFDTWINETNIIRRRMFDALEGIPDSAIISFSRKQPGINSKVLKNIANMTRSNICVIPPGDSPTSKRFFDSLNTLCIPYIFSDAIRFPFEGVFIDYHKFILMHRMKKLEGITHDIMLMNNRKIRQLQSIINEALPVINAEFKEPLKTNHFIWAWFWFQYIQAASVASVKYRYPYNLYKFENVSV
ncbi:hypothetical protein TRFO_17617 [Tritrichomonas foetus]|uniref:Exostosin GT47 domain-containing protein n=1 Tax=Tritrichomonas foetus TaxID=1144522 RepID=A0A1J4KMY2_9EUKA|nr:hypothetical protein TRFO_17617 [Tritrichomonas foetus]|eukprot:OHT12474.1 hypothetical protein TRFO_17617 [Tritrichomonas foetus]